MSSTTETAVFYPNLGTMLRVRVKHVDMLASNDDGTACHEIRHFIDAGAVESLPDGTQMMATLCTCVPRCVGITGQRMNNEAVLGMLAEPLRVTCRAFKNGEERKIVMILDNVLVVRHLPVQLHISIKRLADRDEASMEMLMNSYNCYRRDQRVRLAASSVPAEYANHPYWADDGVEFYGFSDNMNATQSELTAYASGSVDAARIAACTLCGNSGRLMKCARCLNAWYCCREHQREDWPRHSADCVEPTPASS